MPLYIFEPRYRKMLQDCLSGNRMFCIALLKPGVEEFTSPEDFSTIAGIGLVRACVGNEDKTSNLILQGVARVHCDSYILDKPYCEARLSLLKSENIYDVSDKTLRDQLTDITRRIEGEGGSMPKQLQMCFNRKCPVEMLIDLVAFNFLTDAQLRQQILEEQDITSRLSLLRKFVLQQIKTADPGQ